MISRYGAGTGPRHHLAMLQQCSRFFLTQQGLAIKKLIFVCHRLIFKLCNNCANEPPRTYLVQGASAMSAERSSLLDAASNLGRSWEEETDVRERAFNRFGHRVCAGNQPKLGLHMRTSSQTKSTVGIPPAAMRNLQSIFRICLL